MPAPKNLVHMTSTTTGTGNLTAAAVNGKQACGTAFGTGATTNTFDYYISNRDAAEYERGTGHMSDATTLVRDTVIESTNANAAVNFSAGTKDITNDIPAGKQYVADVTSHGDSDYTIVAADRTVATSAALTAARTWTLPAANAIAAGQEITIADLAGGITTTNTLTIARAGSDTIDGAVSLKLNLTYGNATLRSDGTSKWKVVAITNGPIIRVYNSSSGTDTTTPGAKRKRVRMVGGGASGGGGGSAGNNGGDTTFGSLTAGGGAAGGLGGVTSVGGGGAGGSASGGNVANFPGGGGGGGVVCPATGSGDPGGTGGNSMFGGGATSSYLGPGAGQTNTGGGGGGGGTQGTLSAWGGGGGGSGGGVEHIYCPPNSSDSYAVGAGGAAVGAAGGLTASGAGAAGKIIVEEEF